MAFSFLSKASRFKRFNYIPRYYDERKERLELKRKMYQELELNSDEERSAMFRDSLQQSWNRGKYVRKQKQSANLRIVLLILFICFLGYFILNGLDDVDQVIKSLV
jgi:hypothetical protein